MKTLIINVGVKRIKYVKKQYQKRILFIVSEKKQKAKIINCQLVMGDKYQFAIY